MIVVAHIYDEDGKKIAEKAECDRHGWHWPGNVFVLGVMLAAGVALPQVFLYLPWVG